MKNELSLLLLAGACCLQATAQDTAKADATLTSATVYFGRGAELQHQLKLPVNPQVKTIIINQLSTSLDMNSLQLSIPEHTALLSQQFRIVSPEAPVIKHPMLGKWQDSIRLLQKAQGKLLNHMETEKETLDKTNRLIEVAMQQNGGKTVSSVEALRLIQANTAKIEKSKALLYKLREEHAELGETIERLLQQIRERGEQTGTPAPPYGQLTLQVICSKSMELPVELSYYTPHAGFTPLYDVRVNSRNNEIKLLYKASVYQTTGIAWKQARLTLSTAIPNWSSEAPILGPWYLQPWTQPVYRQLKPALNSYQQMNTLQSFGQGEAALDVVTTDEKKEAYVKRSPLTVDPSTLERFTTLSESQLNTSFEIDLPYNIGSDGSLHNVNIREEKIQASLKNYAVPKLDPDAYLLAEISNWQDLNLLPGMANIIMDNTYLGRSVINPNSTADTLNLSLGKDRRVAVKRSLIRNNNSLRTSAGSTRQTFTWEITVKNNKQTEVQLLLKDQFPVSTLKEVEVKLEEDGGAGVNPENGVLTWMLSLKPGESKKLRFSYTVKYPKEMRIANL